MAALVLDKAEATVACVPLVAALGDDPSAWEALRERSPGASPFASWAWHKAWAQSAPADELSTSRTVLLRGAGGAVEAILPFALRSTAFRRQHVTALTWAIGDTGCPDYLDLVAAPEADLDAVIPLLQSLQWDVLILDNLTPGAANAARLASGLARAGCSIRWNLSRRCPYLALPGSWEEYLA